MYMYAPFRPHHPASFEAFSSDVGSLNRRKKSASWHGAAADKVGIWDITSKGNESDPWAIRHLMTDPILLTRTREVVIRTWHLKSALAHPILRTSKVNK